MLLRHGRTAHNHARRIQGQLDVALDDVGLAQAAAVAPAMAALAPDVVWCSDLARTRRTAEPVLAACGLQASYDERLREFHLGERELIRAENVRLRVIGRRDGIPPDVQAEMDRSIAESAAHTGLTLCLAINYGGRDEVTRAASTACSDQ